MNETDTEAGIELVAMAVAVGRTRRFVRHTLRAWGLHELTDTAALIVSELVTNAVRATAAREHHPGVQTGADDDAEGGRRLLLVEAMSAGWGVRREAAGGKAVYAELAVTPSRQTATTRVELPGQVHEMVHLAGEALLARLLEAAEKESDAGPIRDTSVRSVSSL